MAVSADAVVVELLDRSNYEDWSVLVKNYLLAQDLWDVVEEDEEEEEADDKFKAWRKKNATALHKIQISCGRKAFSLIRNATSAKRAWDTLAEKFKPKPDAIVVKVLNKDNYEHWSALVKNYLVAQDLWEVVEATAEPPKPEEDEEEEEDEDDEEEEEEEEEEEAADDKFKAWKKKNATALHKIQISCGRKAFSLIRNATSAKRAWNTLAEKFKPKPFHPRYDESLYKPLFDAVWRGDWNEAKEFLTLHPDAIRARLPYSNKTALYMATELEHEHIVEELVQLMSEEDLEITNKNGWTALALAAQRGNIKMVECMVGKSKKILSITNDRNWTPILLASGGDQWEVAHYLYSVTPIEDLMPEKGLSGAGLIYYFITRRKFGMARDLIRCCPQLVLTKGHYGFPIEAFKPSSFPSGTRLKFWQQWIYDSIHIDCAINDIRLSVQNEGNEEHNRTKIAWSVLGFLQGLNTNLLEILGIKRLREMKLAHIEALELLDNMCEVIKSSDGNGFPIPAVFRAIELGMFEFIDRVLQARPNLVWACNSKGRNLFQFAVECRQEKVYNLFYYKLTKRRRTAIGSIVDRDKNCALHVAGTLSPLARLDNISGAALKMQREVQWFKEVENIVVPLVKECLNKEHQMPREMFTKNHNQLVKEGERWMKETASSCTVVGALIITIMFAAAFTIPGGNNGQTGFPIFLHKKLFMAFIVSDAISLFSSTTSVLMFLGVLTSRYAEDDFLKSLPTKMIIGLSTLFISIATMMVAFSSALFIMVHEQSWIIIPMIFLASIPVTLFIWMQFPLLVEMSISTYGRGIFHRKVKSRA